MKQSKYQEKIISMSSSLHPFALNLTKDPEESKDLLQETVYRALCNEDKYTKGTNLKAWLFTIMKNIFINNYRRKVKRNTIIDTTDNLYYINSVDRVDGNSAETNFVIDDLTAAVNNLEDEYRIPFIMHYEGFKYHEIAEHLKLPLGTVKSRIFFARKDLKNKLKAYTPAE
ncbi:MAG: RNA polymerase sigma factor [Chitinophagaceae bacterium]|nr:MAG: RNA polymerase sigma factor [Chitinophagaceae bacterium]